MHGNNARGIIQLVLTGLAATIIRIEHKVRVCGTLVCDQDVIIQEVFVAHENPETVLESSWNTRIILIFDLLTFPGDLRLAVIDTYIARNALVPFHPIVVARAKVTCLTSGRAWNVSAEAMAAHLYMLVRRDGAIAVAVAVIVLGIALSAMEIRIALASVAGDAINASTAVLTRAVTAREPCDG
jgi:hypothetical protein